MTRDLERREFMRAGSIGLVTLSSPVSPSVKSVQATASPELRSVPVLVGEKQNRPDPSSEFFTDKSRYGYVYQTIDTNEKFYIDDSATDWQNITPTGTSWEDTDNNDLLEPAGGYNGIEVPRADITDLRADNLISESGSFTIPAASQDTIQQSFANTYRHAAPDAGIDVTGGLTGNVQDDWAGWVRDGDGNITGMQVAYRNETTSSTTGIWSVFGVTT